MHKNIIEIINEFNDKYTISHVIEAVSGAHVRNKSLCCPIHGGDNPHGASIHIGQNIFTCWTGDCGKGLKPWEFIKRYYGLNTFKEVAEKVNTLFNAGIPIYEKKPKTEVKTKEMFDSVYNVENFLSEAKEILKAELQENKHILLNANTGLGKTYGITDLFKKNIFADDYIFFLVPTRSIAEQVAEEYPFFKLFYGNDTLLPNSNFIVSTYHKIKLLDLAVENEVKYRAINGELPPTYTVILDECHELMSKRKLLGGKARKIEEFIKNSDSSILMSANTKYINKAYKDTGLFNKYICVERSEKSFNADMLNVYRLPNKEDQKLSIVINTIKDKLLKYDKVLFYEDSIDKLTEYAGLLSKAGIDNIVINSKNKDDEEVKQDYKGIISNSRLVKTVTLTTSLINAGVNIKDSNIALIVKQDKNKFDTLKVEQFLARVRTQNNDLTLLLSSTDKEIKNSVHYDKFVYRTMQEAKNITLGFNIDVAEGYGLDIASEEFSRLWHTYKNNEAYNSIKELIYVDGSILKTDDIAVFEKARLDFEKANYYNDAFIMEQLQNVKVKNIKISYIAPVTTEESKKDKKDISFSRAVKSLMQDSEQLKELYKLATKEIKSAEIKNEKLKEFYTEFNRNKLYKEMLKSIRDCILPHLEDKNISKIRIFTEILNIYSGNTKKKNRDLEVANIRRVEVLNKLLPVNTDQAKIKATGDYVYVAVRKNFDCYIDSNNKISNRAYAWALNDLMDLRGLKALDDKYYVDAKGKKFKIKDVAEEINNCVDAVYEVSEKGYLISMN